MYADNNKDIFDIKGFVSEPVQKLIELIKNQEVQTFLNQLDDSEQLSRLMEMVR